MSTGNKYRLMRFTPLQRIFHFMLMLSFLIQASSGLSRMYIETNWGKWLSYMFGGYEQALNVHIYVGVFMICGFLIHIFYLLVIIEWKDFPKSLFSMDSLIPRPKDIQDFFQHIGWFLSSRKIPDFGRWGYWEKFDYWAVFWGMVIIGTTGILMAYPLFFTRFVTGWGLNMAFWVHRIEALLAMAHIFIIHFFIAHLRRHNFPMDLAIFEGSADADAVKHEKAAWLRHLRQSNQYENSVVAEAKGIQRFFYYLVGYAVLAAGFFLLIGSVVNVNYITW
jgi:formate dehydrogenase gamma subunit